METKLVYQKNADKLRNRVIIPQIYIDKFGRNFYMEINMKNGEIKLIPTKEDEK